MEYWKIKILKLIITYSTTKDILNNSKDKKNDIKRLDPTNHAWRNFSISLSSEDDKNEAWNPHVSGLGCHDKSTKLCRSKDASIQGFEDEMAGRSEKKGGIDAPQKLGFNPLNHDQGLPTSHLGEVEFWGRRWHCRIRPGNLSTRRWWILKQNKKNFRITHEYQKINMTRDRDCIV